MYAPSQINAISLYIGSSCSHTVHESQPAAPLTRCMDWGGNGAGGSNTSSIGNASETKAAPLVNLYEIAMLQPRISTA